MLISRKTVGKALYWTTFFMLVCQFLITDLGLPSIIMIWLDIVVLLGVLLYIRKLGKYVDSTATILCLIVCFFWVISSFIGLVWNGSSPVLYLHALRLSGKYFLLFFISAFSLKKNDILSYFRLLQKFLWLNAIMCTFQYFVGGYRGDHCGGFFGTGNTNGWMNIYLCIITAYMICSYVYGKCKIKPLLTNCILCAYIAALAEIKFYFFELAIIFILAIVLSKPSTRKIIAGVAGVVLLLMLSQLVDVLWSSSSSDAFTLEGIRYYFSDKAYGYASVGDLGRIGGISRSNDIFFEGNNSLVGMGLGMCGYGTSFFSRYGHLHYIWFSYLHVYLEQGWMGIILYVLFFAVIFYSSRKIKKYTEDSSGLTECLTLFAQCIAVVGLILMWYNTTVTNYQAYFLFVAMAFPFALINQEKRPAGYDD